MNRLASRPVLKAGVVLGIGMGGFVDGILFHQIFQIHNMLSNQFFPDSLQNIEINMVWDGLFHAFTWITTAIGISLLWKAGKFPGVLWSGNIFVAGLLVGAGLFNLVEGVIDHHWLQVHHVVQRAEGLAQLYWDLAFDFSGVLLILIGLTIIRRSRSLHESR
jgi:uncharacterized membrane protein